MKEFQKILKEIGWKNFWRLTGGLVLPITMLAILVMFAPTTSFITLFLIPLVIPLLAVNCQKVWYKAMGKNDEDISPFDYGRYYKNGGLYGSLGFLSPTISSALIGAACFTLLTLVFPNLMGAFGQYDVLLEAERIFANNYNDGYTYILDNISAFTGPLVVVVGITLFVALVFFLFFIINSCQGYVTFQKVLPDADLNIVGGASRTMGRTLEKGMLSRRLKTNWFIIVPIIIFNMLVQGGFMTLFSLIRNDYPQLICGVPAAIGMILSTPLITILLISNVSTANIILPTIALKVSERDRAYLDAIYYNKSYQHSKENSGKTPFDGLAGPINANVEEREGGFFDASKDDGPTFYSPQNDDTTPSKPVDEKDDQKSNTDAEKQSDNKSSSPSFGFFDFSSSNDKKDDSNEENGSNEDKKEK